MRTVLASLLTLAAAAPAAAHDFWIAPARYAVEQDAPVQVNFLVGHGTEAEPWDLRWRRIVAFESRLEAEATSRLTTLSPVGSGRPGARITFDQPGHHIIAFASHHATSELPGEAFENYLAEEGLDLAARHRAVAGLQDQPGREIYSRRAKTLIDVGQGQGGDPTRPVGHTLEIVPLADPYANGFDGDLPVQVLFRGEPLAGAQISLDSLDFGRSIETVRTDENGQARFETPTRGRWMLNTVWSTPLEFHRDADFETIFASFTFGYGP